MSTAQPWTIHAEFVVLLVTLIGGFYLLDGKIERCGARTDKLYEMFVENQAKFHEEANKFHDEMRKFHGRLTIVEERTKQ